MQAFLQYCPIRNLNGHGGTTHTTSIRRPIGDLSILPNRRVRLANQSFRRNVICAREFSGRHQDEGEGTGAKNRRENSRADASRRGLEIGWRFQNRKNEKPNQCKTCKGTGLIDCSWCHATGVLMLGDRLVCSIEGHSHCLVCDNGEVQCKACKGTGMVAPWLISEVQPTSEG